MTTLIEELSMRTTVCEFLYRSHDVIEAAIGDQVLMQAIGISARIIAESLREGGPVRIAGNGGSAAQAQHFAAELVGRFQRDRAPLPAIALGADVASLTAIANDYGFAHVFERQLIALERPGTVLVAISTSGTSKNVLRAVEVALRSGRMPIIAMTGRPGGPLAEACPLKIVAPSTETPLVQQLHLVAAHAICSLVETLLFGPEVPK